MSQGTVIHQRLLDKEFTIGTPEEFVRRFNGTRVINKVCVLFSYEILGLVLTCNKTPANETNKQSMYEYLEIRKERSLVFYIYEGVPNFG